MEIIVLVIIIYLIVSIKRSHDEKVKRMVNSVPGKIPYHMYRTKRGQRIYRRDTIRQYKENLRRK